MAKIEMVRKEVIKRKAKQIQAVLFPLISPPTLANKVVATVPKVAPMMM